MAYRSTITIRADIVRKLFGAAGQGITVAVFGSGIDGAHPHFRRHRNLELPLPLGHFDFVRETDADEPLTDKNGNGTSVAGIIAGELSSEDSPITAHERAQQADGTWQTEETKVASIGGVAPECKVVSFKVLDEDGKGPVSSIIKGLRTVAQVNESRMLIHVVCIPLGYAFDTEAFACGQSPLCVEANRLVRSGVVVVVPSGNTGFGTVKADAGSTKAGLDMTINDPGNAELAITVGCTHRDLPQLYGVSYFSSKGPTLDGRLKPDLVAPGEKVVCCVPGDHAISAQYREASGVSIATAHVAGAVACLLSVRRDLIGQPEKVKDIFLNTATDLGRVASHQGRGLIDLLQAVQPRQRGVGVPLATTTAPYERPEFVISPAPYESLKPASRSMVLANQGAERGPLRLMYSYSHFDEKLKEELDAFLAPLAREGLVSVWSDRAIVPGSEWEHEILSNLESADLIVLIVSAYFMKSDYCWSKEMTRAVQRHEEGSARVIPVIVSHADWQNAPFAKLQGLPKDARPISSWHDQSEGWNNVAKGIRTAAEALRTSRTSRQR